MGEQDLRLTIGSLKEKISSLCVCFRTSDKKLDELTEAIKELTRVIEEKNVDAQK